MNELNVLFSILERKDLNAFMKIYRENGADVSFVSLGYGTLIDEETGRSGLADLEKAVITSMVTADSWKRIKKALEKEMQIDLPGKGIAFIVPVSSIGGKAQLKFLYGKQSYELKEESVMQDTKYELLVIISNIGYSDMIMEAARSAGAGGGTVIHARGTGMGGSVAFLGITLASEKEMIYVVTRKEQKNAIMKAVMEKAGLNSKAQSVLFSLPVSATAGMRFAEMNEEQKE